ncbi:Lem3/Cdc50, partial [Caulochytrium protostelioides]
MSDPDHAVPAKSHRPGNTAIKQQRLPSWQLVLTPKHTIPVYFVIALLFIPVGVGLYYAQSRVHEVIINYTNCDTLAGTTLAKPPSNAGEHTDAIQQWSYDPATKLCTIQFRVGEDIATPVYMQYRLTNFFQNHRKYTKNFDRRQLRGDALSLEGLHEGACTLSDASGTAIGTSGVAAPGAVFYPCGIIANSFFLDEIADNLTCIRTDEPLPENAPCAGNPYPMTQQGISWASDRSGKWSYQRTRYLDPATLGRVFPGATNLTQVVVPPPDWIQFHPRYANGYTNETVPDLSDWERFQAWMKPAGHSTFRKPWGKNTELNLQRGTWQVQVAMYYDVKRLEATKSLVLTNMGPVGGRNRFLGSSYAI